MEQQLFRVEEVGRIAAKSRSAVYVDMKAGLLESLRIGGSRRITREQLDRYLARLVDSAATEGRA